MRTSLLILAAGPLQVPGILEAKALGLRTIAVDGNGSAVGLSLADKGIIADILDPVAVYEIAKRERVDAIFSLCSDQPMRCLADVARRLGLPGLSPEAARNATDKRCMRAAFAKYGAPSPKFTKVTALAEAQDAAEQHGYPVALKIASGAGSRGVYKVLTADDLTLHFTAARQIQPQGELLLEEWLEGEEISVEGFCADGKITIVGITDKEVFAGPYPVESGHSQPSHFQGATKRAIHEAVIAGIRALGLNWTTFHAELKVTANGPRLIEIGPRLGGDRISTHLTPLSTGVNLVRCGVLLALGEQPGKYVPGSRGAAIKYFHAGRTGVLEGVAGLRALYAMPGLELLYPGSERDGALGPGFAIGAVRSSLDRYGHVVFSGSDRNEAMSRADAALSAVRFEFADELRDAHGRRLSRSKAAAAAQTCSKAEPS